MVDRLILGSGSLVPVVVDRFDRPVTVGTADDQLLSTLRGSDVEVRMLDPTDREAIASLGADLVFVLEDTEQSELAALRAARRALPDAYLIAHGDVAGGEIDRLADRVLSPRESLASRVTDSLRAGAPALWTVLRDIDRLLVVAHDNPDPDAIASGVALARLARVAGCAAEVCYYGEISHHENRAFVNALGFDLESLSAGADLSAFDGVALVDHARPGVNDGLPAETPVDIVIDHHPPHGPVDARFVDLCQDVGATSTLLVEHFERYGLVSDDPDERTDRLLGSDIATALLFGIRVDTDGFTRGLCKRDFAAASTLVGIADQNALDRIESPSIDRETFDVLASAIERRRTGNGVLLSGVGSLSNRDALPQAADRLLRLEGIETAVTYGVIDGTVHVSARSSDDELDLGETVRRAFDPVGDAGGHVDMAGAQIGLGMLGDLEPDESVADLVESVVTKRLTDALDCKLPRPVVSESSERYYARVDDVEVAESEELPGGSG